MEIDISLLWGTNKCIGKLYASKSNSVISFAASRSFLRLRVRMWKEHRSGTVAGSEGEGNGSGPSGVSELEITVSHPCEKNVRGRREGTERSGISGNNLRLIPAIGHDPTERTCTRLRRDAQTGLARFVDDNEEEARCNFRSLINTLARSTFASRMTYNWGLTMKINFHFAHEGNIILLFYKKVKLLGKPSFSLRYQPCLSFWDSVIVPWQVSRKPQNLARESNHPIQTRRARQDYRSIKCQNYENAMDANCAR